MPINNPALYNAALSGACGGYSQSRLVTDPNQTSYTALVNAAKVFAAMIDAEIPTIPAGATAKHVNLLLSICQNTLGGRAITSLLATDYLVLAKGIAAEYREYHDSLLNEPSSTAIGFFPLDAPSGIPGYSTLSRNPTFGVEDDDTVTIDVGSGITLLDQYITVANDPDDTSIQGLWLFNLWRYVSSTADPTYLTLRVYKYSILAVETLLFETVGNIIGDTVAEYELLVAPIPSPLPMASTDRLVLKIYATTASAVPITVHFLHNGSVHASYIVAVN
jgi:hypothetical protein